MVSSFSQAEVRDPPLHGLELRPAGGRGRHYPSHCRRPVFPHPGQKPGADLQPLHRRGGRLDDVKHTQFTIIICDVLNKRKFKLRKSYISDAAEFDTHQGICTCMCLNKKLLAEVFNTFLRIYKCPRRYMLHVNERFL